MLHNFINLQIDKKFEYPRQNLLMCETLGQGEFGVVKLALATDIGGL